MTRFAARLLLLAAALLAWSAFAAPSPETTTFEASAACPAYLSKNRRTNPGDIHLQPGERYPLVALNRPDSPDWYRVVVATATPRERWVAAHCGTLYANGGSCRTPGLADGYVLALSWQPEFCAEHHDKPECRAPYQRSDGAFTLHGLWPERTGCGREYAFCAGEPEDGGFCAYPPLPLSAATRTALERVMPSAAAGSCLQRHEWHKHGSCGEADPEHYFTTAIALTEQFNTSGMGDFMTHHRGERISQGEFIQEVDDHLGPGAHERLQLRCRGGDLSEVRVTLPAPFSTGTPLRELIHQGKPGFRSNCGATFRIEAGTPH